MEKDCYKDIIEEVSKKLADKFCSEEKGLAARATMIDQDVQDLVQEIGLKATKNILEVTRDEIVAKKTRRIDNSQKFHNRVQHHFWKNRNKVSLFMGVWRRVQAFG